MVKDLKLAVKERLEQVEVELDSLNLIQFLSFLVKPISILGYILAYIDFFFLVLALFLLSISLRH